jgi:hypothetical protein
VAGVGGGVALILILTVALIAALQRTPSPTENDSDRQGTTQTGGGIEVDTTSVTSPDGVELSALAAESRRDSGPPLMGDTVTVSYSLTNVRDQPVELAYTFVGVRDPDGNNRDTEEGMNEGQVLAPGETINAQGRILLDSPGTWELWPCYILSDERYCPDKWQLIYVLVE